MEKSNHDLAARHVQWVLRHVVGVVAAEEGYNYSHIIRLDVASTSSLHHEAADGHDDHYCHGRDGLRQRVIRLPRSSQRMGLVHCYCGC